MISSKLILVTGATGYVGGRLVPRLLAAGYRVRCMVRDPARLQGREWLHQVDVVPGDMFQPDSLVATMRDIWVVYYLIHSLGEGSDFSERDLLAARNCAQAARAAGVERIIYLGGLGNPEADLSPHLRSRHQTGDALREAGVPVTEFQAAVIVGSGSLSFEMIRYLTERLPVMICPKPVFQPEKNAIHFHLIYASRHQKGLTVFKDEEKKAVVGMEQKRADAQQRKRESGGNLELFASQEVHDTSFCDSMRSRYLGRLKSSIQHLFSTNKRISYDKLLEVALGIPLVWESDLKALLEEKKATGKINFEGFEPRQKVPKAGAGNIIVVNACSK
jgi:hypothetical protein